MKHNRRHSDASLVRLAQRGDRDAFVTLVRRYDPRLHGLAYRLLLDAERADGALENAYLTAWREIVRLTTARTVGSWLYRLVYNACVDVLRHLARQADGPAPPAEPVTADGRAAAARRPDLVPALKEMAPELRVPIVLVDLEGFSTAGAARVLGITVGELRERLTEARAQLRDLVVPERLPSSPPTPSRSAVGSGHTRRKSKRVGRKARGQRAPGRKKTGSVAAAEVGAEPDAGGSGAGPDAGVPAAKVGAEPDAGGSGAGPDGGVPAAKVGAEPDAGGSDAGGSGADGSGVEAGLERVAGPDGRQRTPPEVSGTPAGGADAGSDGASPARSNGGRRRAKNRARSDRAPAGNPGGEHPTAVDAGDEAHR